MILVYYPGNVLCWNHNLEVNHYFLCSTFVDEAWWCDRAVGLRIWLSNWNQCSVKRLNYSCWVIPCQLTYSSYQGKNHAEMSVKLMCEILLLYSKYFFKFLITPLVYFWLDWVEICPQHPRDPEDHLHHALIYTVVTVIKWQISTQSSEKQATRIRLHIPRITEMLKFSSEAQTSKIYQL